MGKLKSPVIIYPNMLTLNGYNYFAIENLYLECLLYSRTIGKWNCLPLYNGATSNNLVLYFLSTKKLNLKTVLFLGKSLTSKLLQGKHSLEASL